MDICVPGTRSHWQKKKKNPRWVGSVWGRRVAYCGVPIQRLTMHVSPCRLGKNRITSEGGKCVALAVKNSTSIVDVG